MAIATSGIQPNIDFMFEEVPIKNISRKLSIPLIYKKENRIRKSI